MTIEPASPTVVDHCGEHFTLDAIGEAVELADLLALWTDARNRGWTVTVDPASQSWRAANADRSAGMAYDPPCEIGTGHIGAHDAKRTLTLTGVGATSEAVTVLRDFFGWSQ